MGCATLVQVIVFALSKRQCEELAGHLKSVQLNSKDEGALVESIFWGAMDILSPEDRRLPQICNALPMLQRGIGVHHSGLLPIVKEVIEVLFGEGLIKVPPSSCTHACRVSRCTPRPNRPERARHEAPRYPVSFCQDCSQLGHARWL